MGKIAGMGCGTAAAWQMLRDHCRFFGEVFRCQDVFSSKSTNLQLILGDSGLYLSTCTRSFHAAHAARNEHRVTCLMDQLPLPANMDACESVTSLFVQFICQDSFRYVCDPAVDFVRGMIPHHQAGSL